MTALVPMLPTYQINFGKKQTRFCIFYNFTYSGHFLCKTVSNIIFYKVSKSHYCCCKRRKLWNIFMNLCLKRGEVDIYVCVFRLKAMRSLCSQLLSSSNFIFSYEKLLPFQIHNFSLIKNKKSKVLSCQCNIIGRCWPKKFIRSSENSISPCCAISPVIGFFIQLIQVRSQEVKMHQNLMISFDLFLLSENWFLLKV